MKPQLPLVVVVAAGVGIGAVEAVAVDAEGLPKEGVGVATAPRGTG
jgi:hypothetical protein